MWFDRDRNLLIYPASALGPVQMKAVNAKLVGGGYVAVERTLENSQALRHYKLPIPPIISDYDWPIEPGRKPLAHQITTANFTVTHPHCFNLSDMGTMKTLSTLWAADWLMRQYPEGECRGLIICPLSIVERVWGHAIYRNFLDRRAFRILHGTEYQRLDRLAQPADFYIVNHDGICVGARTGRSGLELGGFSAALRDRSDIRIAIVDEATAFKDSRSRRSRIGRMVFGGKPYLWSLTGTPVAGSPLDAYGLARLVNNALGRSFTGFRADVMYKPFPQSFKWLPKADAYDKARALLTPAIRFDIKDVWNGPEMTTQQRQVALTSSQVKHLQDIKRSAVVQIKEQRITAVNEAAIRTKYLQIVLGAIYDNDHEIHLTDAKPRIEELKAVIEEASSKLLVFASLTSVVNLITKELAKSWAVEAVYGDVSSKERNRIFQNFQTEQEPRIIVADPGTMAHGLDLYAANTVVWFGPTDKVETYLQANKRAHRPGQKHPVTVVQLVATALEREIYHRLDTQTSLQGALLDVVKKGEL